MKNVYFFITEIPTIIYLYRCTFKKLNRSMHLLFRYMLIILFVIAPQVTLLHVKSSQELMSSHSFRVDSSVENITLHVTGILIESILTSPLGNCTAKWWAIHLGNMSILYSVKNFLWTILCSCLLLPLFVFVFDNKTCPIVHLPPVVSAKPVSAK